MKKISIVFFFAASCILIACDNRDEKGVTDTNNTNLPKNETDSTRGDKPSDTSANTTPKSQQ